MVLIIELFRVTVWRLVDTGLQFVSLSNSLLVGVTALRGCSYSFVFGGLRLQVSDRDISIVAVATALCFVDTALCCGLSFVVGAPA